MTALIDHLPRHLLDELVVGSWLPIVGAGFSKNATVNGGESPASWAELGSTLGREIGEGSESGGTLEQISAFEQAYGRVALIDRTAALIRAHDASPGGAHLAFARVPFTNIITTNFDLLLERAYERIDRPCLPVVDETQLSAPNRFAGPRLIKFHGDINHPARMVITEDDYNHFLQDHPLLATSVTAMLVEKTGVLIGYSLDDPDMRQVIALIKRRLGRMNRPLWSIQIGASPNEISKYQRRGVKVVNLPKPRGVSYGHQLEQLFTELAQYWRGKLPETIVSTDDRVTADFRTPEAESRICYFAVSASLIGWYRDVVFPEVEAAGLVPVTSRDVLSPPGTIPAKLDTLIDRAALVVAEIGDRTSEYEAATAMAKKSPDEVLLIATETTPSADFPGRIVLIRPLGFDVESEQFVAAFRRWLENATEKRRRGENDEPERLLRKREYGAALISAVSLLEVSLSKALAVERSESVRPISLRSMLKDAWRREMFTSYEEMQEIEAAVMRRNQVIHAMTSVSAAEAKRHVTAIRIFVNRNS